MEGRTIIVLDDEDAQSAPDGYIFYVVRVEADQDEFRTYRVCARTEDEALQIALDKAAQVLEAYVDTEPDTDPDYTIMDAREWALDALFAEGMRPNADIWEQGEVKQFVSIESSDREYWMAFSDTLRGALEYFETTEGHWEPEMIVDLDTGERHLVGMKAYVIPPENALA